MNKTIVELFAGVGGFHLGLSNSGNWKVLLANQWEPGKKSQHAFDCYSSHFSEAEKLNIDIAEINNNPYKYPIPDHTLLVGGFPCQDYSVARTGAKGMEGKKGVLWWEIKTILERKKPPFVLLENVDRLLKSPSSQRGRDFGVMLSCFNELGYGVEWRILNAAEYGFAQRRRRVFIFAFHKSTTHFKRMNNVDCKSKILHSQGFFQNEFQISDSLNPLSNSTNLNFKDMPDLSDNFKFEFLNSGIMINGDIYTEQTKPIDCEPTKLKYILESNVDEKYYIDKDSTKLEKWQYLKGAKKIPRKSKTGHEYTFSEGPIAFPDPIDRPARTMLTSESSVNRSSHVVEDPITKRLRLLTPVEAERINGFGDNWTNTGMPEKFRYFCMGNALVVGLVRKMGITLNKIVDTENDSSLSEVAISE